MVDSLESLALTQLRAIRTSISDVQVSLCEVKRHLANLEGGQTSIIQHLGYFADASIQLRLATDGVAERVVRIERRLDLRKA